MPTTIRISTIIAAPRDHVFAAFANFPESARVLHSATRTDFKSPNTTGLGAEWLQFDEENPGPEAPLHKIVAFEPPASYTMTTDDPASFETMHFRFAEEGAGTRVEFDVVIQARGLFKSLLARLLAGVVRGYMKADLARIKEAIEAGTLRGAD